MTKGLFRTPGLGISSNFHILTASDEPAGKFFAGGNLLETDEFVWLVRLFDATGAAYNGWETGFLELPSFGGIGDRMGRICASESEGELFRWRPGVGA